MNITVGVQIMCADSFQATEDNHTSLISLFSPLGECGFDMVHNFLRGLAQIVEIGLSNDPLCAFMVAPVAVYAIMADRKKSHKTLLRILVRKDGRTQRAPVIHVDLNEVVVHQLARLRLHPIAKRVWIRSELTDRDFFAVPFLVVLHQGGHCLIIIRDQPYEPVAEISFDGRKILREQHSIYGFQRTLLELSRNEFAKQHAPSAGSWRWQNIEDDWSL